MENRKYETIKKIMASTKIKDHEKVYYIEMFLKGYHSEEDIQWIWAE